MFNIAPVIIISCTIPLTEEIITLPKDYTVEANDMMQSINPVNLDDPWLTDHLRELLYGVQKDSNSGE